MRFLLPILALVLSVTAETYHNEMLIEVTTTTKAQIEVLKKIETTGEPWTDFWSTPRLDKAATIRINKKDYGRLTRMLRNERASIKVVSHDVQNYMEEASRIKPAPQVKASPHSSWTGDVVTHTDYRTYSEIREVVEQLQTAYSNLVLQVGDLDGTTYDGNTIQFVRFGSGSNRPVIFIESLIHAREWIVGGSMVYFMDRLVGTYSSHSDARYLLDNFEIVIVPVMNPDGYIYSHTNSRLWRKNRKPCATGNSRGVDLNRNFDADFGQVGVSHSCNSETYCGPNEWSEAESQMVRDKVQEIHNSGQYIAAYFAVHSYSQLILTPYSYADTRPSNFAEIDSVASLMTDAMVEPFGTNYQWGHGPEALYPVSGASDDWARLHGNARYSYTFELRPATSSPGFTLGATHIIPNGYEFWQAIVAFACNANIAGTASCTF